MDGVVAGSHKFPMQETAVALPSGRLITVLNLVVYKRAEPRIAVFSIQYRTSVPADDFSGRSEEAAEVAAFYREFAESQGFDVIRSEICNTQAAAETREGPEAIFRYVRGVTGNGFFPGTKSRHRDPPANVRWNRRSVEAATPQWCYLACGSSGR